MTEQTLYYIRKHKDLYRLLREESHYYQNIFQDNRIVYELNRIAKEKYKTIFIDKVENIGNKINILSSFLDLFS